MLFLLLIVLLMGFTYVVTLLKFQRRMKQQDHGTKLKVPTVPYCVPGLFHTISLLDPAGLIIRLRKQYGSDKPLLLRAGIARFFITTNPNHVNIILRNSKKMTNLPVTTWAMRHLTGVPEIAVQLFQADDSGVMAIPRKGSQVAPERRLKFLAGQTLRKFLAADHLVALNENYLRFLIRGFDSFEVSDQWVSSPDLYALIQRISIRPSIQALVGSKIFEIYPGLIEDLILFQSRTPQFFRCIPLWLIPRARDARRRLIEGIKRWHSYAFEHSDINETGPDDPDWEPFFGTKMIKTRQQYSLKVKEMTPDAIAAEDLGLLFAATTNVITSTFWFTFEVLKDRHLLDALLTEISESMVNGRLDINTLTGKSLMQSVYAEILRLYTASGVVRQVQQDNVQFAGYSTPRHSYIVAYGRAMAFDNTSWLRAGRQLNKPLEEFDPERFLVDSDWTQPQPTRKSKEISKPRELKTVSPSEEKLAGRHFSMDGLLGFWIPYGGGENICPGRHFAKHEIFLTFAALLTQFDIELMVPDPNAIIPDLDHEPFGALPPLSKVPFRMRRRMEIPASR